MHDASPVGDADLAAAARGGCKKAAEELLGRHEGIVRAVVRDARFPVTVDAEDLLQVGRLAIFRAATSPKFDENQSRWTTYAMTCVRRAVWREIGRQVGQAAGVGNREDGSIINSAAGRATRVVYHPKVDDSNFIRELVGVAKASPHCGAEMGLASIFGLKEIDISQLFQMSRDEAAEFLKTTPGDVHVAAA